MIKLQKCLEDKKKKTSWNILNLVAQFKSGGRKTQNPALFSWVAAMETDENQRILPFQLQFDKPIASQVRLYSLMYCKIA